MDFYTLLNEANAYLGIVNADGSPMTITPETISVLNGLSEEQQRALIDRTLLIAQQRGHENVFSADKNSFRQFLIDIENDFGWTIEDYMLEVLEGITPQWVKENYTDAEQAENLVKDYEQKVRMNFHSTPFRKQFPTTIRDYEYKKVFYPSKFSPFINRKVGMLSTSAEIWLQNSVLIDEVVNMAKNGDMVVKNGMSLNSKAGILTMLETLRGDYNAFTQPNSSYNADGVISITPDENLIYMITKASYMSRVQVREFSGAFNLDQMKLDGRIIYVPEDYDLGKDENGNDILWIMVDRRAIVVAIKMWKASTFYVSNQYKTNHWLGVEGVRGHNRFINAVAYSGEAFGNFTDGSDSAQLFTQLNIPAVSVYEEGYYGVISADTDRYYEGTQQTYRFSDVDIASDSNWYKSEGFRKLSIEGSGLTITNIRVNGNVIGNYNHTHFTNFDIDIDENTITVDNTTYPISQYKVGNSYIITIDSIDMYN